MNYLIAFSIFNKIVCTEIPLALCCTSFLLNRVIKKTLLTDINYKYNYNDNTLMINRELDDNVSRCRGKRFIFIKRT